MKQYAPYDQCCWICTNCSEFSIAIDTPLDGFCIGCPNGYLPNQPRNFCSSIPETFMDYTHPFAIGSILFSLVGIISTTIVIVIFIIHINTPVIKASGRELSLYLLGAIMLSFVVTFIIVAKPSPSICGLTRLFIGLCFTIVYGSILTKTNRISRIFTESTSPRRTRMTSPKSQLLIVNVIVGFQVLVLASWLSAQAPETVHTFPTREENVLVCAGADDSTYMIAFIYPFILLLLCTFYAFKTRKTPDGFNESKLIAFTCYTTCVIWLAFFPIYFVTHDPFMRTMAIAMSTALNATVALACVYIPKVYICIFRPQKNTREAIMNRSTSVISSSSMLGMLYGESIVLTFKKL